MISAAQLDRFDVSTPAGFLALLVTTSYAEMSELMSGSMWQRANNMVRELHPIIFDLDAGEAAAKATRELIYLIAEGHSLETERRPVVAAKAWLLVFEEAFNRSLISSIAWGAAVASIMTIRGDEDMPSWYSSDRLLGMLRQGDPVGVMNPDERRCFASLPATVTLYRGGCTGAFTAQDAVNELRQGIHWTPMHSIAEAYMRYRCEQRFRQPGCGLPAIIKAAVPKSAILACLSPGGHEMLVDFEAIEPGMVTDLDASSYPAGVAGRIAA